MHTIDPLYTLCGLLVGLLVGLTGVGGGSLMTPLLVLVFGIHPAVAVGTDLLYAAITKSVGTAVHGFNRNVDWRLVRRLAMGSAPATALTVGALYAMGAHSCDSSRLISFVVGIA
ncbi:MAG: sulfite exporter TauE/SafE family protein, partial [Alphaproteobacteria bacterium]|nr:sulfite exporter TauE/SafE family protein [Alphaproteobacteria bacterium]